MKPILQSNNVLSELTFIVSRSGGPGGQNVNKVNSKVTLKWDIANSSILNAEQKSHLIKKLFSRVTKEGTLMISAQESRSQWQNKETVLEKLDFILFKAFEPIKERKATKPSKSAKRKRLQSKKLRSEKKQWRQKP